MTGIWGSPERFFATTNAKSKELTPRERQLGKQLEAIFPNLKERVERGFRQSNQLIREALRLETRLRLSIDEKAQAVPVRVVDGVPPVLLDAIDVVDPDLLDLYLRLSLMKSTIAGLECVMGKYHFLEWWPQLKGRVPSLSEVQRTREGVVALCDELERLQLFETIWQFREDVFGAYFFRQCRIELYWMAIGLEAAALGCSPEALTQVVATHELAHAYTHIGFDLDDRAWDTEHFAHASDDVVEGLAQFFTRSVCVRMAGRFPEALKAFETILERQTGPYRAHLSWVPENESGGEAVRGAMLLFRSHTATDHDTFLRMLEDMKGLLGRRPKNGANHWGGP